MDGWHTFSVWWKPDEYVFYVDGNETWRTKAGGVCQVPLYIKLSDEVGDWFDDVAEGKPRAPSPRRSCRTSSSSITCGFTTWSPPSK